MTRLTAISARLAAGTAMPRNSFSTRSATGIPPAHFPLEAVWLTTVTIRNGDGVMRTTAARSDGTATATSMTGAMATAAFSGAWVTRFGPGSATRIAAVTLIEAARAKDIARAIASATTILAGKT